MTSQPPPQPTRSRPVWLAAGATLVALAVTAGPITVGLWLARQTETQDQTYPLSGTRVELDITDVDVRIVPGRAGEVAVERHLTWSYAKPKLDERWDGSSLRVTADCAAIPVGPRCDINYAVHLPPGTAVVARLRSGDLKLRGMTGDLDLSTGDGDLHVDSIDGRLSVRATSGDVTATGLRCNQVDVQTTTGDVRLRFTRAPERVEARTTTGDVRVAVPSDTTYRLRVDAPEGELAIDHTSDARRTITIRTDRGRADLQPSS